MVHDISIQLLFCASFSTLEELLFVAYSSQQTIFLLYRPQQTIILLYRLIEMLIVQFALTPASPPQDGICSSEIS